MGEALIADTTRWGVAHVLVALGSVLTALALLAVRDHLRSAGEDLWSRRGLLLAVAGSVIFAMPPAMEIGALAATEVGVDAEEQRDQAGDSSAGCLRLTVLEA